MKIKEFVRWIGLVIGLIGIFNLSFLSEAIAESTDTPLFSLSESDTTATTGLKKQKRQSQSVAVIPNTKTSKEFNVAADNSLILNTSTSGQAQKARTTNPVITVKITQETTFVKEGEKTRIHIVYGGDVDTADGCVISFDKFSLFYGNGLSDADIKLYNEPRPSPHHAIFVVEAIADNINDPNEEIVLMANPKITAGSCTLVSTPPVPVVMHFRIIDSNTDIAYMDYFHLKISEPLPVDAFVHYRTLDGTAKAGIDYIYAEGKAIIPAGQTSIDIGVNIIKANTGKTFSLMILNPVGAKFPNGVDKIVVSHTINSSVSTSGQFKGQFIDSPVAGLSYAVGNISGVTDEDGYFNYENEGEDIYFSIGKLKIGVASADAKIHINDLRHELSSVQNTQVAQLLLSLDIDKDASNNIQLPTDINEKFNGNSGFSFNLPQDVFDEHLKSKLAEWGINNFVDANVASEHIKVSGIELAKICPLKDPLNPYTNKIIKDLSCIDKSRLDYFYKRVAPLLHSQMNAEYAQTVIIEESYNENAVKNTLATDSLLSSFQTLDAGLDTLDAVKKGQIILAISQGAGMLSKAVQTFINSTLGSNKNKSDNKTTSDAIIRLNKQAQFAGDLSQALINDTACYSIIINGRASSSAKELCTNAIIKTLEAAKYLYGDSPPSVEEDINTLINSMVAVSETITLATATNITEAKRAVFGISESILSLASDGILSTYRAANDGRDPAPSWNGTYITLEVIDNIAKPIMGLAKECFGVSVIEPIQQFKCISTALQEARKQSIRTAMAIIGNVTMAQSVQNLNAQVVASRVLEEFLFSGSSNQKKVYEKYNIAYGGTEWKQFLRFGALIEEIGKKEFNYNGIAGYEPWFSSMWKTNNPFAIEDVRSIVSSSYTQIINNASHDFESPAISIDIVKTNIAGQRRALISIDSTEHYNIVNTKLVCYSDYDSTYPNTSPWSGSFKDTHNFFVEENKAAFDIEFTSTGRRTLSCNLYAASGTYLGSQSVVFGVLQLEAGADKTIIEGQTVQLDVPKLLDSNFPINRYYYTPLNSQGVYCDTSDAVSCSIEGLTVGNHEVFVLVDTENGIRETAIIKITVLPTDADTDNDQMPDLWELQYAYDPEHPNKPYLDPQKDDAKEDADGDGVSNYQEYIDKTDPTDPSSVKDSLPPPNNLKVTSNSAGNLIVTWDTVENASLYTICMAKEPITTINQCSSYADAHLIGSVSNNKTISTGIDKNTQYYFRVRAVDRQGNKGAQSEQVNITLQSTTLTAPTGFTAIAGNQKVSLSWNAVNGAAYYNICYALESIRNINDCDSYQGGQWTGGIYNKTNIEIKNLNNGTKYYFKIVAVDSNDDYGVGSEEVVRVIEVNDTESEIIIHNGISYGTVTSPYTGRVWLDRNLGASRTCITFNDNECYGDYYQWGRNTDGHEKVTSEATRTFVTDIDNPGNTFIKHIHGGVSDWLYEIDQMGIIRINRWKKIDGSSICPSGYKVPTMEEILPEVSDLSNKEDAFSSFLKFPTAGGRDIDGNYMNYASDGYFGVYWTVGWSNVSTNRPRYLLFSNSDLAFKSTSFNVKTEGAANGFSVRCVAAM